MCVGVGWCGRKHSLFAEKQKLTHTQHHSTCPLFRPSLLRAVARRSKKRKNFNQFFIQDFQRHNCAPLDGKFVGGQSAWKLFAVRKQKLVCSHLLCFLPRHCLGHFVCGCVSFDFFFRVRSSHETNHHFVPHTHTNCCPDIVGTGRETGNAGRCVCVCVRAVPATTSTEV